MEGEVQAGTARWASAPPGVPLTAHCSRCSSLCPLPTALPLHPQKGAWQDLFMCELALRKNWRSGKGRSRALPGHTRSVVSVSVRGSVLASGSLDRSIRLWDLRSGQVLRVLHGHQVRLWWRCSAATPVCKCTHHLLCGCLSPQRGVWALCFHGKNLLVSGSHDHTIKVSSESTQAHNRAKQSARSFHL